MPFRKNDIVKLHGLTSVTGLALNGGEGRIVSDAPEGLRWSVLILKDGAGNKERTLDHTKVVKIKEDNLSKVRQQKKKIIVRRRL